MKIRLVPCKHGDPASSLCILGRSPFSPPSHCSFCVCVVRGGGRGVPEEKRLLSPLGILPGALTLEPVPQSLRRFPLRMGLAFSCVWRWGAG